MEFRILGPLDVGLDGRSLPLGGPKQRAVLALLLLSANRVVSRDRLIQELWPDQELPAADHALRLQISRLRKALGATDAGEPRLVTRAPGYLLRVEPEELDLHRFERLVAEAQGALERREAEHAAALLRDADSLWRGRPLADLEFEPFARVDVERLEELRLAAVELRIDAELELGRHATLVPQLEALVAEHPLRERLRAQLMRALYANARQAEALAVYTDTRRLLVDELGIEPSEELRALERRVLNQDPGLLARAEVAPLAELADVDERTAERRQGVRWAVRRRLLLLAGSALAAVLVGTIVLAGQGHRPTRSATVRSDSVAFLDARSGKLVGQTSVGPAAGQIAFGAGSVWKLEGAGALLQIDSRSLRLIRSIPLGMNHGDVAVGAGAVWVSGDTPALARVDPKYGAVQRIPLPRGGLSQPAAGGGVAVGAGSVWVAQGHSHVTRLDPATGRVERRFPVADADVLAFGGGALWVANSDLGTLTKIDPRTDTVAATVRVGPWICCLAVGGGYAWAANDTGVWKVSATGDPVATTKLPNEAGDIAYGGGALWVTAEDTVIRIDGATNAVKR